MLPIPFEGSRPIHKPVDMTDEQCMSLEVQFIQKDEAGFPFFVSYWMPSKEDIEAINAGGGVWLKVVGVGHPPVSLFTLDQNGIIN